MHGPGGSSGTGRWRRTDRDAGCVEADSDLRVNSRWFRRRLDCRRPTPRPTLAKLAQAGDIKGALLPSTACSPHRPARFDGSTSSRRLGPTSVSSHRGLTDRPGELSLWWSLGLSNPDLFIPFPYWAQHPDTRWRESVTVQVSRPFRRCRSPPYHLPLRGPSAEMVVASGRDVRKTVERLFLS